MPQSSITTTPTQVLGYDAHRKLVFFRNIGTAGIVYLTNDDTQSAKASTSAWYLRTGDGFAISAKGPYADKIIQRWVAFANSGTITLAYEELSGEDSVFDIALLSGGQVQTESDIYFTVGGVAEAVQGLAGKGPFFVPRSHYGEEITIADNENVPAGNILTTIGEDVSDFENVSINLSADGVVTAYYQVSDDATNWYDPKTAADGNITFALSNEKLNIPVDRHTKYLRLVVNNASAAAVNITAVIMGRA